MIANLKQLKTLKTAAMAAGLTMTAGSLAPSVALAGDDPKPIVLRIGTQAPKGTPWGKLLIKLRKRVREASNGRVRVKLYWLGKLGSENILVRRCQKGTIDGLAVSTGALGNAVKELNLIEAPYLFASEKAAYPKLAKATPLVKQLMSAKGMTFLMWGENGMRNFMSKEKLFKTPGDLRAMKMRSQPSDPHKRMYRALGAAASTISIGELKQSLASSVVTGFDNSFIYTYATGLHKEIKYVTLTKHIYQPAIVAWCDKGLEAKKAAYPELMKVIMDIPKSWEADGRKAVSILNRKLIPAQFKKAGIEVYDLSASQRAAFKAATAKVLGQLKAGTSADGRKLLNMLK